MSSSSPQTPTSPYEPQHSASSSSSPTATTTPSSTPSASERRATFRKRRLSLPLHHLSVGDNDNNAEDNNNNKSPSSSSPHHTPDSADRQQHLPKPPSQSKPQQQQQQYLLSPEQQQHTPAPTESPQSPRPNPQTESPPPFHHHNADAKAHTFRKRRLSLTHNRQPVDETPPHFHPHEDHPSNSLGGGGALDTTTTASPQKRARRGQGSIDSIPPPAPGLHRVESKTMHSSELIFPNRPPPSPAVHHDNVLYTKTPLPPPVLDDLAMPPAAALNASWGNGAAAALHHQHSNGLASTAAVSSLMAPVWRTRQTIQVEHEPHKLPFPADIVGTFSCHGMEPVYDSCYDSSDSDDDDDEHVVVPPPHALDDDWNIGGGGDGGGLLGKPAAAAAALLGAFPTLTGLGGGKAPDKPPNQPPPQANGNGTHHQTSLPKEEESNHHYANDTNHTNTTNNSDNKPTTAAKINQDRGGVAYPYGNCPRTALFAVYDGHGQGGELVSQFALHEIQRRLEKHAQFSSNLAVAFKETFCAVDEALKREPIIEPLFSGTTACVALLTHQQVTVSNAGDSRAVIARRISNNTSNTRPEETRPNEHDNTTTAPDNHTTTTTTTTTAPDNHTTTTTTTGNSSSCWQAVDLTVDQNPDLPSEFQRITAAGGYVSPSPGPGLSARVWLDPACTQIGLAMARSIGDHAVSAVGVIAEPVVTCHDVLLEDEFMILASDGVWEFVSSQQAVDIVGENLHRGSTKACQALIEAAAAKWHEEEGEYRDDITAIVVQLQRLWDNNDNDDKNDNEEDSGNQKDNGKDTDNNDDQKKDDKPEREAAG